MAFHEIRFPTRLSYGSSGGPERRTDVVTLVNGHEERNATWADSRRRYDAGLAIQTLDDIASVIAFFEARNGRLHGFRWKDWSDFSSCPPSEEPSATDQALGTGDGQTTRFFLQKLYASGAQSYVRKIRKPKEGSVRVALGGTVLVEGTDWTLEPQSGAIDFLDPPAIGARVTAGFEFDVPVRFDTDVLDVSLAGVQAGHVPSIPVVEIRLT